MSNWLPSAYLLLSAAAVIWDVATGGRIAQSPQARRGFALVSGLAGFLIAPAALIGVATATSLAGTAALRVDWIWPVTLLLFVAQAAYATIRRVTSAAWGVPILVYDLAVAAAELTRYATAHGVVVPDFALAAHAAERGALALTVAPAALASPLFLFVPIMAPAYSTAGRLAPGLRAAVAGFAAAWLAIWAAEYPVAYRAVRSYARHENDLLSERPDRDFAIGLSVFPIVGPAPQPGDLHDDVALADSLFVDAIAVVVTPSATGVALDSVSRALQELRRDSTLLIVTLAAGDGVFPVVRGGSSPDARGTDAVARMVRHMHPDIVLLPIDSRSHGGRSSGRADMAWRSLLINVARAAKHEDAHVQVGVALSRFDALDSAVYAWAASPGSPADVIAISLAPSRRGAFAIDSHAATADRWMLAQRATKPHWVFTSGYPLAHGERNQERAVWAGISWATRHRLVKGVVIGTADDYDESTGLRSPEGQLRLATYAITRAVRGLRESPAP
jgi:hypothetical protein